MSNRQFTTDGNTVYVTVEGQRYRIATAVPTWADKIADALNNSGWTPA